jgi:hypothetical protein
MRTRLTAALLPFLLSAFCHAQTEPPHPVLAIPNVTNSTATANTILSRHPDETAYLNNFVPRQFPREDGFAPSPVVGDTNWSWSSVTPNQIKSMPSGLIFPGAAGYPVKTLAVTVLNGTTVQVPYYNAAGSTTRKSFVEALINDKKRDIFHSDLAALADAYMDSGTSHATRNQAYARRIAVSLYDLSKYVPSFVMTHAAGEGRLLEPINVGPNYMITTPVLRCGTVNVFDDELSPEEITAFDAIYDSPALATLSSQLGVDVRAAIKTNLIENQGDYFVKRMTPLMGTYGNVPKPPYVLSLIARAMNRPDYMPWLDSYFDIVVAQKLNREGNILESFHYTINYNRILLGGVTAARDYFLTRPANTPELLAIQSRNLGYINLLNLGINLFTPLALPNRQMPSFGDTTFNPYYNTRTTGLSGVMGGFGTVALGAGSGINATQLSQSYSGEANHKRSDMTSMVLYAFNNEYLANIRYLRESLERQFVEHPVSNNQVVIDRADMSNRSTLTDGNGDLTLYEPGENGLAVTEIDGQRIYSAKASRYQRIMMLNTRDVAQPYVVDVFRVTGGTKHEYVLHGAINFDQTGECSFPLTPINRQYPMLSSDAAWDPPTSEYDPFSYYGMFRNFSSAVALGDFQITFREPAATKRDLRLWMTDGANTTVNLGRSPTPHREHKFPPTFFTNGFWRPSTLIERNVTTGTLSSLFVSVIEPMKTGVSIIQSVERLPVTGNSLESCALRVTLLDGRVDTYLVNLRNPEVAGATGGTATVATSDGKYSLTGRIGLHSQGPTGTRAWNVKATDFKYDTSRLTVTDRNPAGTLTGELRKATGATYDAFVTTTPLPLGTALRGKQLKLTFGTLSAPATVGIIEMFTIDQVLQVGTDYHILVPNDHFLDITGTVSKEQMTPKRTFNGANTFEIQLGASTTPISEIPDATIDANSETAPIPFSFSDLGSSPAASLQVTVTSSNTALVPNLPANLQLTGTGASRSLVIVPLDDQAGTSTITVTLTDGKWTSSRSFQLTVVEPASVSARASGSILSATSWTGASLPTAGDAFSWKSRAFTLSAAGTQTFLGHTLRIETGGTLTTTAASSILTLNNLLLTGGTITTANNLGLTLDLSGDKLTLNSGTLRAGSSNADRDIRFRNGSLAGAGTIAITGSDTTGSDVEFQASVITKGFHGLFDVNSNGILNLSPILPIDASFGVIVSGTGKLAYDANLALTSLSLGGSTLPNGSYTWATLTTAQRLFFHNPTNATNFTLTIGPSTNTPPSISNLPDQSTDEATATALRSFTIADAETATAALALSGSSSNTQLVPSGSFTFGGSGANRTVIITPAPGQSGTATITVTVSDGNLSASDTFLLTVNGAPDILGLDDLSMNEDAVLPINFTLADDSTPVASLVITRSSSSEALLPDANLVLSGTTGNRTLTATPLPNQNGVTTITVTASDGTTTSSVSFDLTVNSVNDAPTLSPIADQAISLNSSTGPIQLAIGDVDNPLSSLDLEATSSNPSLIPLSGISFNGSTMTITPTALLAGSSTITLTVSDGALTATDTFIVTVHGFACLFNTDANFEGWVTNANTTGAAVTSGALNATLNGADPQITRSASLNISGSLVPTVLFRMRSSSSGNGQLFFSNELAGISAANSVTFPIAANSELRWYAANMAANANWTGRSIRQLRFDPPGTTGSISIDSIISSDGDLDNDGMPDTWEITNSLDPSADADALLDSDGDGITNHSEFVFGSNPAVPNRPSSLGMTTTPTGISLTFVATTASGASYSGITRTFDLVTTTTLEDPASWVAVPGFTNILGNGQTITANLPLSGQTRFYRLSVRLSP